MGKILNVWWEAVAATAAARVKDQLKELWAQVKLKKFPNISPWVQECLKAKNVYDSNAVKCKILIKL